MTQVTARVSIPAAGLCFLENHPRTTMGHLVLKAQTVIVLTPHQPSTVRVSNFGDKLAHLPRCTTAGIALPSPLHIMTTAPASLGVARPKEKEENGSE